MDVFKVDPIYMAGQAALMTDGVDKAATAKALFHALCERYPDKKVVAVRGREGREYDVVAASADVLYGNFGDFSPSAIVFKCGLPHESILGATIIQTHTNTIVLRFGGLHKSVDIRFYKLNGGREQAKAFDDVVGIVGNAIDCNMRYSYAVELLTKFAKGFDGWSIRRCEVESAGRTTPIDLPNIPIHSEDGYVRLVRFSGSTCVKKRSDSGPKSVRASALAIIGDDSDASRKAWMVSDDVETWENVVTCNVPTYSGGEVMIEFYTDPLLHKYQYRPKNGSK